MDHQAKTSLIARQFSADLCNIELTQLNSVDPLVFNGVGTICQDHSGRLNLKLFQQNPVDFIKTYEYREEKVHRKLSATGACSLRAVEYGGTSWTCDYVRTTESLHTDGQTCTGIVWAAVSELERIHGTAHCFQKSAFEGIVPIELELPYNLGTDGRRGTFPEEMLRFAINKKTKVEILRCDGYTSIKISNKFELISRKFIDTLMHALSIATGRHLNFIWQTLNGEFFNHQVISEYDFELSKKSLQPPLNLRHNAHFVHFLEAYINFSLRNSHNFFGYWEKLHASWASGIHVAALPLSVYIEGIMKEFYPDLLIVDPQLKKDVESTVEAIRALSELDPEVKKRICTRIEGQAKGTAVNGLRELAAQGLIEKKLVRSWQEVRHRSAHGNDFTQSQVAKIRKFVGETYSCLHLFYELLHIKLEYSGYIIDYSTEDVSGRFRYAQPLKVSSKAVSTRPS